MCSCSSLQTTMQIATRFGFHRTTVAKHLKQAERRCALTQPILPSKSRSGRPTPRVIHSHDDRLRLHRSGTACLAL